MPTVVSFACMFIYYSACFCFSQGHAESFSEAIYRLFCVTILCVFTLGLNLTQYKTVNQYAVLNPTCHCFQVNSCPIFLVT